jgi:hypothetical protein
MPAESIAYTQAQEVIQSSQQVEMPIDLIDEGNLRLWTDKTDYNVGETMAVNFSVDKEMYVRVVVINSDGEISTLFPNVYQTSNHFFIG